MPRTSPPTHAPTTHRRCSCTVSPADSPNDTAALSLIAPPYAKPSASPAGRRRCRSSPCGSWSSAYLAGLLRGTTLVRLLPLAGGQARRDLAVPAPAAIHPRQGRFATEAFIDDDFELADELYTQAIMTRDPNLSAPTSHYEFLLHSLVYLRWTPGFAFLLLTVRLFLASADCGCEMRGGRRLVLSEALRSSPSCTPPQFMETKAAPDDTRSVAQATSAAASPLALAPDLSSPRSFGADEMV